MKILIVCLYYLKDISRTRLIHNVLSVIQNVKHAQELLRIFYLVYNTSSDRVTVPLVCVKLDFMIMDLIYVGFVIINVKVVQYLPQIVIHAKHRFRELYHLAAVFAIQVKNS